MPPHPPTTSCPDAKIVKDNVTRGGKKQQTTKMTNLSVQMFGKAHGASETRVVEMVIKTKTVTLKSNIGFKILELPLVLWYKSADRVTGG